jgi:hypothetical protein
MNYRAKLEETEAKLRTMADHLRAILDEEPPVTPPVTPGLWGTNGEPPMDMPDTMLPTWMALGADTSHPRGGYSFAESVAHIRAHNGYTGTGQRPGGSAPVQPPAPPPPVEQPDGSPGLSWVAAPRRMPFRIMEERSAPGAPPVTVRIQPKGYEARLFTPAQSRPFDADVPCDVDVEVTAMFAPNAWGTQSTLKIKGLPVANLSHVLPGRSAQWEPSYAWGHERTSFGSSDGPVTPANWRTYTIPGFVMSGNFRIRGNAGVQGMVVWILDHLQPRG